MAGDKLHDEKLTLPMREVIHDSRKSGMTEVRQQLSFASECPPLFISGGESFFHCHDAAQVLVHRLIDGTHPTVAELVNDSITLAKDDVGGKHVVISDLLHQATGFWRQS